MALHDVAAQLERRRPTRAAFPFVLASLALHALALLLLARRTPPAPPPPQRPMELVVVEVQPPPPPPPEPQPEPARPPPPVKVARAQRPPPPAPKERAPPPPNDTPPPEQPARTPPLVVGISMSSTTTAGTVAAPVGNTVYGKAEGQAQDPAQVQGYKAPRYVPAYQVDREPQVVNEVKAPYPEEARRAGIEGGVVLSIRIDETGKVTQARVLSGPGYGLNEAALEYIRRYTFRPAVKDGEPVATEIKFTYTFLLD